MKENRRKKKSLIALLILVIVGVIGFTLAYFSDSITIGNEFKTKKYGTSVTEEFVSPDNWTPGTTTEKSVLATNTGNVDEAVRISYTEKWVAADGTTVLSGWVDENGNVTDHAEELATDERAAIINFDNESDWTLSDGYYYYNYKLEPNESTSSLIESVTFNSIVQSSSDCKTVDNTTTCTSTGNGYDGSTYTLTFTIESVQYDQYKNAWGTSADIASEKPKTGVQTLLSKANGVEVTNYADGDTKEMYTFEHPATEQTGPLTDYRYIGDSPSNYVYFNCDENDENCETWRIVGVFSIDDGTGNFGQRMKLVRGELLTNIDTNNEKWDESRVNEWSTATLNTYLNGIYFNSLSTSAQSMIEDAKFYLGGIKYDSTPYYGNTENIYNSERGTEVYYGNETSWIGKVALLYPSDNYYTYAKEVDNNCYKDPFQCAETYSWGSTPENPGIPTKGWIYNSNIKGIDGSEYTWLLSPLTDMPHTAFLVDSDGHVEGHCVVDNPLGVRPTVYLKSSVKITSGDGSSTSPYKLSL